MSRPPKHAVILLGAGASVSSGCPVMGDFIDKGMDLLDQDLFTGNEKEDVSEALELHRMLRTRFNLTELDVDNIENLLSLADLAAQLDGSCPIPELSRPEVAPQLRRFIDAVISKSGRSYSPGSIRWSLSSREDDYKHLVQALAFRAPHVTVINLNWDCLLEYSCHCMGVPFSYEQNVDKIEILKLHGSTNWMRCSKDGCDYGHAPEFARLRFQAFQNGSDEGFLDRVESECPRCESRLTPIIVPPTWAKDVNHSLLRATWRRAAEALRDAEVFVAIGCSIPEIDAHVRHLLHIGFSSGKLRQALIIVGSDPDSAARWRALFRAWWQRGKVAIWETTFTKAFSAGVLKALVIPTGIDSRPSGALGPTPWLPLPLGRQPYKEAKKKLEAAILQEGVSQDEVQDLLADELLTNWMNAVNSLRNGVEVPSQFARHKELLEKSNSIWTASEEMSLSKEGIGG